MIQNGVLRRRNDNLGTRNWRFMALRGRNMTFYTSEHMEFFQSFKQGENWNETALPTGQMSFRRKIDNFTYSVDYYQGLFFGQSGISDYYQEILLDRVFLAIGKR